MIENKNRPANRLDADESPLFARSLDYVMTQVFEEKLAPVTFRSYLPVTSEMPVGATTMTRRVFKGFGHAKMLSDYSNSDFPRVDVGGHEISVTAKDIGVSYGYSIDEIRRAIYGGIDLESRRAIMARIAIERKLDALAWSGDADYNIVGFLNYPGIGEYTVPATGTGTTKTWSTKTPAQILTDLNGIKSQVYISTNGVESINTILLPMAQFDLIKNTPMGTASDTTIYTFFKENNPGIEIAELRQLDGAGAGSADRMIGYRKDPNYVRFEVPVPLETFEAERDGMNYVIPMRSRTAGVMVFYPLSVAFGDGI